MKLEASRLWHAVKVLYHMLRKTVTKHKLMVDLNFHLVLERNKIAGKSIRSLLHPHLKYSFNVPREVEFSCSNTPHHAVKRKGSKHQCRYNNDHVSAIAKAFEMLNSEGSADDHFSNALICSPTDLPFPISEREDGSQVDRDAEEFIKRFYEQLRLQQPHAG